MVLMLLVTFMRQLYYYKMHRMSNLRKVIHVYLNIWKLRVIFPAFISTRLNVCIFWYIPALLYKCAIVKIDLTSHVPINNNKRFVSII